MFVRAYRQGDDAKLAQLLGPDLDRDPSPNQRVHVAEENGQVLGAVFSRLPDAAGGEVVLGAVETTDPNRRDVFYSLVRAVVVDALDAGHTTGFFELTDGGLLARLRRDFRVEPEVVGRAPSLTDQPGPPLMWRVRVDLADALAQLDSAIARLPTNRANV